METLLIPNSPYKFEAPWSAWEFAYHILHKKANLVIISLAWLTRKDARAYSRTPKEPDMDTLSYWLARMEPLIRAETIGEIIVVFANRCGVEDDAVYAGTSAVLGIEAGEVKVYGILGRGERELLVVDTNRRPQAKLVSMPMKRTAEPRREKEVESDREDTADKKEGTNTSGANEDRESKEKDSNRSHARTNSKSNRDNDSNLSESKTNSTVSDTSVRSNASETSVKSDASNLSVSTRETMNTSPSPATPDTMDLCAAIDARIKTNITMDDIMTPLSPVDADSPSAFFAPKGRYPEPSNLHESLKSIIGQQQPFKSPTPDYTAFVRPVAPKSRNASRTRQPEYQEPEPKPESPKFVRPPSPKSRNASRTRRPEYQEPALASHDLADQGPLMHRTFGVTSPRFGSNSPPTTASTMPEQYQAPSPGPHQTLTPKGLLASPRPTSA
jgi:protein N-terminal amidase